MSADSCIFCKIVAGSAPSHRVYEDDKILCFMDIYPATDGHVLIIPREHAETIFDISEAAIGAVAAVSTRIARAIRDEFQPDGMSVVQANGPAAGQTVLHYHVHVIPRASGQKLRLHGPRQADAERLSQIAGRLAGRIAGGA